LNKSLYNAKTALVAVTIGVLFSSCTSFIAPAYTSVDELIKVRKGMSMEKVNGVLGIDPFDIYSIQDDGGTVLVYNYRLKDRRAKVSGNILEFSKTEAAQKSGIPWYGEASRAYILFEDDKMAGLITDNGRQDAEVLMIVNNNLQLIAKKDLVNMNYNHNSQRVLLLGKDGEINSINVPKGSASDGMKRSIHLPKRKENVKQQTQEKGGDDVPWWEKKK